MNISAKPIEWDENKSSNGRDWFDKAYGFSIQEDLEEDQENRFSAAWGEDDSEYFSTEAEAKDWCQDQIDSFIRAYAVVP